MKAANEQFTLSARRQRLKRHCRWAMFLLAVCTALPVTHAADPEITDQYRLTLELNARIITNFAGSGTLNKDLSRVL